MISKLNWYLSRTFFHSFFTLFFTLFTISSVVAIIRLADITAVVKLGTSDFFRLYLLGVPQLFFYSLPMSFFIAASLAISKLSVDNEITAMTALGATKAQLLSPMRNLALVFTFLLLFLGLFVVPLSNIKAKSFVDEKKATSRLNLEPNSVGQKFGDWYVFALGENGRGGFSDVVLYSKNFKSQLLDDEMAKNSSDKIIYSKSADIRIDDGLPTLFLGAGQALIYDENLSNASVKKLEFGSLLLREEAPALASQRGYFLEYWLTSLKDDKRAKDLTNTILVSLSPLLNILLSFAFGVSMSRRDKNRAIIYSVVAISIYYILILSISPKITFFAIPLIVIVWFAVVRVLYQKSVFYRY